MAIRRTPITWINGAWPILVTTALLLTLQAAEQAAPAAAGSPNCPPVSAGADWGAGPMGQRSADARFIVMMIPHHQGAIAMAELAIRRARRPEIRALAQRIIAAQSSEITRMRQWYRQWYGREVPAWGVADGAASGLGMGAGMGMGGRMGMGWGMPGMGTSLEVLRRAPDFDRAFIEQMIPHHRMGVMMATHAEWNTRQPQLRELEAAMVRLQSQEIDQMASWYRQWFGGQAGQGG